MEVLQKHIDKSLAAIRRPGSGGYHRQWEILAKLEDWAERRPDLVELHDIGRGGEVLAQGGHRRILAARFGLSGRERPRLLLFAGVHARELATSEVVLLFGDRLLEQVGKDPELTSLLHTREIWLIPCLNPDGREYCFSHDPWWRKNRTLQDGGHVGVDLNRNFSYHWGANPPNGGSSGNPRSGIFRGKQPFSEPETRALRDLVRSRQFSVSLALHGYGEMILQPFGYARQTPSHPGLYQRLGSLLKETTGYQSGPVPDILGYFSNGRHDDWLYADRSQGKGMVVAAELEIGRSFFPRMETVQALARSIGNGVLALTRFAGVDLQVQVHPRTLASGEVEVVVELRNQGRQDAEEVVLRLERTDPGEARSLQRIVVGTLRGLGRAGMRGAELRREVFRVEGPLHSLRLTAYCEGELPVKVNKTVPTFAD
jgi:hypothetical protein